jgi:hypothetical protein
MHNYPRCDACGARSSATVTTPAGDLDFCAHHFRENVKVFEARGYLFSDPAGEDFIRAGLVRA